MCEDLHGIDNQFCEVAISLIRKLNAMGGVNDTQAAIHSLHFYPFLSVIEKAPVRVTNLSAPKHGTEWQPFL
jgi:hypothetical protein